MAAIPYEVITWDILPYLDVDERVKFNQLLEPKDRFYKRMSKDSMEIHDIKVSIDEWNAALLGAPGKGYSGGSRVFRILLKPRMVKTLRGNLTILPLYIELAMDVLSHDEEWFEGRPERREFQKAGTRFLEMYAPSPKDPEETNPPSHPSWDVLRNALGSLLESEHMRA